NAPSVRARIIVERANGPTSPQADDILASNGVTVVPDVLANASGVTVTYLTSVQNSASYYWNEGEVIERLEAIMRDAYASISATAAEHKVTMRTATFITACSRILEAHEIRGLYP